MCVRCSIFPQGVDPNRPITEVFCCVDPAKYINSFDIGRTPCGILPIDKLIFLYAYRYGRSLPNPYIFSIHCESTSSFAILEV